MPRIDIWLPADSLAVLLAPGNEQSNYHWHATFTFDDGDQRDTVYNVGLRFTSTVAMSNCIMVGVFTEAYDVAVVSFESIAVTGIATATSRSQYSSGLLEVASISNTLLLYPNPTDGIVTLDFEEFKEEEVSIKVVNSLNQRAYRCFRQLKPAGTVLLSQ